MSSVPQKVNRLSRFADLALHVKHHLERLCHMGGSCIKCANTYLWGKNGVTPKTISIVRFARRVRVIPSRLLYAIAENAATADKRQMAIIEAEMDSFL